MTDQELNIKIAEACGWRQDPQLSRFNYRVGWRTPSGGDAEGIPNYCNDLNAMHEAIKTLSQDEFYCFAKILKSWCVEPEEINATARQRAEAFIKTIA